MPGNSICPSEKVKLRLSWKMIRKHIAYAVHRIHRDSWCELIFVTIEQQIEITQIFFHSGCDGCEEWYHGDCINVTEKESKHIKHYFCQRCKEEDPTLQTVFRAVAAPVVPGQTAEERKAKKAEMRKEKKERGVKDKEKTREKSVKSKDRGCGSCDACTSPNCGNCNSCLTRQTGKKHRCENRICLNVQTKKDKSTSSRGKRRRRSPSPEVFINPDLEGVRQCYGMSCRMTARPQSKYCSDTCGLNLATYRIFKILPQRIQERNLSVCVAEEINKRQLDSIRAKQALVRTSLADLERRHRELDAVVDHARTLTLEPRENVANNEEDESSMYCITCGHEIHSRTAIRHMEKCFNKYESQASFGSNFKTRVEGNSIFCDFFNPASNTYCKRLRVLCPEHCKDAKVSDSDVCGCPLVVNIFTPNGEYCRARKKNCFKHYVWEKMRRAEIDLERLRQYVKMDDLNDQEQKVRAAMASRAGVLSLMLHSTYNHEIMERLCRPPRIMK